MRLRMQRTLVLLRRLVLAATLLLLLSSRLQAAPIELEFTFHHYTPIVSTPVGLGFTFFRSPTNGWPGAFPPEPFLAQGGAGLVPGASTHVKVSLDTDSVHDVYFSAYGSFLSGPPGENFISLFVAAPPSGPVPGALALGYGPPWISLRNIGAGFSGELQFFYGYSIGPIGTWRLEPETPLPVPEPASLLLFASGIAALAANRYRQAGRRTPP